MHLSQNPLSKGQNKLLRSRKPLGRDSPQVKKVIINHLDKSVRYLHNIFKDPHNLDKNKIYDKINAQTLNDILENSLKEGYDFRTIEIARTLFEISKQYLEQNPILRVHSDLPEDLKRSLKNISDSYFILAKSALEKQANVTLSSKDEKRLRNHLDRLKKTKEELQYKDKKYIDLEKEKSKLQNEVSNLDYKLTQKNNSLNESIKEGNTGTIKVLESDIRQLKEKQKENHQKNLKIQDTQKKMFKEITNEEKKIWKDLGKKYEHLKPYFSLKNRLDEFGSSYSPHKPEKEQAIGL